MSVAVDRAILKLCAAVCESPSMLTHVAHHVVDGKLSYPSHAHGDVLQLDLAIECEGGWVVDGRPVAAKGATAVVLAPGVSHGYALRPAHESGVGEFFTFKLRMDAASAPAWPGAASQLRGVSGLTSALRRLHQYWIAPSRRTPVLAAAAVQALCLWPTGEAGPSTGAPRGIDARLERVLDRIDRELHAPPPLNDLAREARLSARQLMRRFRGVFGCSVGQYVALRRAARAKELLAAGRLNVSEVAAALGFSSLQSFSRWFRATTGMTPTQARSADLGF
jgi:AraC-like DNA-binding protein